MEKNINIGDVVLCLFPFNDEPNKRGERLERSPIATLYTALRSSLIASILAFCSADKTL